MFLNYKTKHNIRKSVKKKSTVPGLNLSEVYFVMN
ncbi:hypothetical protein Sarmat_00992 [Rickettsiales endosymbiont of Paramecium tredecaurelia]|nr:hypothetical protein [Candidatus Sarmatiella mevalonica]